MNFTRSMEKFYINDMNILKKAGNGDWEYGKCKSIEFGLSDIYKPSGERYH